LADTQTPLPSASRAAATRLRARLISFATMSRSLRWLAFCVIALLVIDGALLAATNLPVPPLATGFVEGKPTQVSSAIYVVALVSLSFGWMLALTAALLTPLAARLLLVTPVLALLASGPVTRLADAPSPLNSPSTTELWLRGAQLVILGMLALYSVIGARPRAPGKADEGQSGSFVRSLLPVAALMASYTVVELTAVFGYASLAESGRTASAIAAQANYLPVILVVVVYWGSTDFIEWGQEAATSVGVLARRLRAPTMVFGVVGGVALVFLADLFRLFSLDYLLPAAGTTLALLVVVALVARYARPDATWPAQVPMAALVVGVALLYALFQIATAVIAALNGHVPSEQLNPLYTVIFVAAALALVGAALWVIARGRARNRADLRAAGFFLATMGLLFVGLNTPQLANVFGLPVIPTMQLKVPAIKLVVLTATVLILATLALRRRLTRALAEPFVIVLGLIMGLQVIYWFIYLVQPALSSVLSASVIVAALLFLVAIVWDFLLAGEQVTNRTGAIFQRETRVLLYLGYVLVSTATLVYLKSVRFVGTEQVVPLGSQSNALEGFGAIGLGLPLIAYTFVQGLAHWRGTQSDGSHGATPARADEQMGEGHQRQPHSHAPVRANASALTTTVRVGSALVLATLMLVGCARGTSIVSGASGTPTTTAAGGTTPTATALSKPRPMPTPTVGVITEAVIASWSNPTITQPASNTVLHASSVANNAAAYSTTVEVQFAVGFGPPQLILQFDYYDVNGQFTKLTTLVSGTPKVVNLTIPCVQNQTYFQVEALVYHVSGISDGQAVRTSAQVSVPLDTSRCSSA
jgi:hypothetical protein